MTDSALRKLYEACAADLRYGIGSYCLSDSMWAAMIQVYLQNATCELLEPLRPVLQRGVQLVTSTRADGSLDVQIATREVMTLKHRRRDRTDVLRAPVWDATLDGIDPSVYSQFERMRTRLGWYMLVVHVPGWELMAGVFETHASVSPVRPNTFPPPPAM